MLLPLLAGPVAQKALEGMVGIFSDWIKQRMDKRDNQSIRDENLRFWKELAQETMAPVSLQVQGVMEEMSRFVETSSQAQISVARCLEMNCELQRAMTMMQVTALLEQSRARRDSESTDVSVKRQEYQFMLDNWPLRAEPSQIVEIYGRQLASENGLLLLFSVNANRTMISEAEEESARSFLERKLDDAVFRYNVAAAESARARGISRANVLYPSGIFQRHECGEWQARLFHRYLCAIPTLWLHVRLTADGPELTLSWWGANEDHPNRRHISLESLGLSQNLSQDDLSSLTATATLFVLDSLVLSERQGQIAMPLLTLGEDQETRNSFEQAFERLRQISSARFEGLEQTPQQFEAHDRSIVPEASELSDEDKTLQADTSRVEKIYFSFEQVGLNVGKLLHAGGGVELFLAVAPCNPKCVAIMCFESKDTTQLPRVAIIEVSEADEPIQISVKWIEPCISSCFASIADRFVPIRDWDGPGTIVNMLNLDTTRPRGIQPLAIGELQSMWLDRMVF